MREKSQSKGARAVAIAWGITAAVMMSSLSHGAIIVTDVNMFRDIRGPNDVGVTPGDRIQYGGNVAGGSAGTFLGATYPPTGFTDPPIACSPLAVNRNFCSNSTAFNANRIQQPWNLTFTRAGETPLTVQAPSLVGSQLGAPSPTGVTISGSGTTPTISWTLPQGYTPDGFRVQIFDRSQLRVGGQADIIHSDSLSASARSYTLPATLDTGGSLKPGGNYAINFQVIETRDNLPFRGSNRQILARSNQWYAFSPLPPGAPANVNLPVIQVVGGIPVHRFQGIPVTAHQLIFIDPAIAVGYDYLSDPGSPLFESVLLPTGIGDNIFDLWLWNGSSWFDTGTDLLGGNQFFFGSAVDRFRITGIETEEGLDPFSTSAFITGVSFATSGVFNGSMTPLVVNVPEPGTLALLFCGFTLVGWSAYRRKTG